MQTKIKTTLNLDSDIIKTIKLVALNKGTTQTKIINEYLKQGLLNEPEVNKKSKIPDYLIANKETYDPNYNKNNAGLVKNVKPFDAVKLIRDVREGR